MHISQLKTITRQNQASFEKFKKDIFPETMKWEGGGKLHNVSGDSGGWTKYGIAYNYWNKYFKDFGDFKDTTYDEAAEFFYVIFFLGNKAHLLPCDCQHYYYDMAVNLGSSRAVKYLQQCIGVPADGIIGPVTESRMKYAQLKCLHNKRVAWYEYLGKQPHLRKFLKGWLNRAMYMFRS